MAHKFGGILRIAGYVSLIAAVVLAAHHPAIITLLVIGGAALFFGRWFEKSS